MAATSVQLAPSNDTDANFRLWGKAISDQLAAGGWVQTADTGQINWATVAAPNAAGQSRGYEIWRSNDAGGGLTEFYLKIEYGSSNNVSGTNVGLWLTLGWTSNGSGTLTGIITDRTNINLITTTAHSTSLFWSNLSAAPGRAQVAMFCGDGLLTNAGKGWAFSIERLRNASFAQTNNILLLAYKPQASNTVTVISQVINPSQVYPAETSAPTSASSVGQLDINHANAVQSGQGGVALQFGQMGGVTAPSSNVFGGASTSLGAAQTNDIKITTFGTERNYIVCGGSPYFNGRGTLLLMRFE